MATKDVLEALAAGAGRQSAIGGLMFQDAQKREARDYAAALEKEKYRRTGEATALKNARGAYKFKAERHFAQASKYYTSYVNAKRGVGIGGDLDIFGEGGKYTEEDIAQFKLNYEEAMANGNQAMKLFMRYSGIEEEYTPELIEDLSKITGGAKTTKAKGKLEQTIDIAVGEYIKNSPENFITMGRQQEEGKEVDINHFIETINTNLEDVYKEQRAKGGYSGVPSQADLDSSHLTATQEKKARALIMKRIKKEHSWEFENIRARASFPSTPVEQTYSPQQASVMQGQVIEAGVGDEAADIAGFNEAVGSEVQTRLAEQGAPTDPLMVMANQVAADRAEQAAVDAKQQGMISSTEYKKAYTDAQKTITQMFTERGNVTRKVFEAFLSEQGFKGIELMAYRQAFKDLTSYGGSMQRLQNQPSRFEGLVPPDESSGSALQQWWKPTKRGTRQLIDKYKSLHNR